MSDLIRSFIAVPLTARIHEKLSAFTQQYGLNNRGIGFKPVKPENIHLTLKFLGEIDQSKARDVSQALDQIITKFFPFTASVHGIGAFPGWDHRARVVWVGLEPVEPFIELNSQIDAATVKLGIRSEGRAFSPHLTLARISFQTTESGQVLSRLKTLVQEPEFGEFEVDRIALFRSVLQPHGPVYSILSSHPFPTQ